MLILLLLLIKIPRILFVVWLRRSWQLPAGTSKALYTGMQCLQILFFSVYFRNKIQGVIRKGSRCMKNFLSVWLHMQLSHVRNFEPWIVRISFYRLVVFQSPLQGKGYDYLSYPSFLQLAQLFLNFLSMMTCDVGNECLSKFSILACFNLRYWKKNKIVSSVLEHCHHHVSL